MDCFRAAMGVALAVGTLALVGCGDDADATRDGSTAADDAVLRIATVEEPLRGDPGSRIVAFVDDDPEPRPPSAEPDS